MPRTVSKPITYLMTYRRMHTRYSQKDVAFLLGHRTGSQVARWEHGTQWPSLENCLMLGHVLKTPVEVLFGGLLDTLRQKVELREAELRLLKTKRTEQRELLSHP